MAEKKYYWLKLKEDFFDDKYIKALRKLPDGEALVIVYLKMQLKSLKTEGFIKYDHILPSQEEELALILDEDINSVRLALTALVNMKLVESWSNDTLYMAAMQTLIGSETAVAERVRRHREKQKALPSNTTVTNSNTEIEIREKRKDKEIDKELEIELDKEIDTPESNFETLWALYPKKQGKANAYKAYQKAIKKGITNETIRLGIENYLNYIRLAKVKPEYTKNGSTWFNQECWNDDYSVKKVITTKDLAESMDFSKFRN